jgi:hypothetical protein
VAKLDARKTAVNDKLRDIGYHVNSDMVKAHGGSIVYLVRGVDAERNAWYYVAVDPRKTNVFEKALNDDIIHLEISPL